MNHFRRYGTAGAASRLTGRRMSAPLQFSPTTITSPVPRRFVWATGVAGRAVFIV